MEFPVKTNVSRDLNILKTFAVDVEPVSHDITTMPKCAAAAAAAVTVRMIP
ncbi:hypothetical protein MY11210_002563 [Beauveria gryllotalpidicola]